MSEITQHVKDRMKQVWSGRTLERGVEALCLHELADEIERLERLLEIHARPTAMGRLHGDSVTI